MSETKVPVFFYGSFINKRVLAEGGYVPLKMEIAQLCGFDVRTQPLVTLVRSERDSVYGVLCDATHRELDHLYGQAWVQEYQPEPVVVVAAGGRLVPALCYIAPAHVVALPDRAYLERVLEPARELGFPSWYVQRLEALGGGVHIETPAAAVATAKA
jgi:hypothetical protein